MDLDISMKTLMPLFGEFLELYKNRPISDNKGGMSSSQTFWIWYILKQINPEVVIENGVLFGQNTWLIEKTCPNANIISIEPNEDKIKYKSKRATYLTTDFNDTNWFQILGQDKCTNTVAIMANHSNNYLNLRHGYAHDIGYMIFNDNYTTTQGDNLSLKKILTANYHILDIKGEKTRHIIPTEYKENVQHMCDYFECPPIYLDTNTSRWNDSFKDHNCKPAIITRLEDSKLEIFKTEQLAYNFMGVVKMKN